MEKGAEIKKIAIGDALYPGTLREIKDPPKILYFRGEMLADERCFAVIGTRRCSDYGKRAALEIAGDLAEAGLTIVSGLAPGLDTFAHRAAVEKKKRTIAVLGTGPDDESIYPQFNLGLAREILQNNGCLMSEYPPKSRGSKFTFPRRNRIISGLSLGILVVEAREKSGSLITADFARRQKRKIFALPGPVHSLNSRGCHWLIKQGTDLAENATDILSGLDLQEMQKKEKSGRITVGDTVEENLILESLREKSLNINQIIEKTGLAAPKAASSLAILEIKGKVRNLGGDVYTTLG